MAEPARARARSKEPASEPQEVAGDEAHAASTCPVAWCPICLAVTAVQPIRPDVIEHLLKAGTEMLLAFRGVIDARADGMSADDSGDAPTRLEKIDIG
jgi:hypothetical protein